MHYMCKLKYFEPPTFCSTSSSPPPPCTLLLFFSVELKPKLSKSLRCECAEFPPARRLFRLLASFGFINISSHLHFLVSCFLSSTPSNIHAHFFHISTPPGACKYQTVVYLFNLERNVVVANFFLCTYSSFSNQHS